MEDFFIHNVFSFFMLIDRYCIDNDYNEFYQTNGKSNYEMIVSKLKSLQLPDIDKFLYTRITYGEMLELIEDILNKIFNNAFHKKFNSLSKKIVLCDDQRLIEGKVLLSEGVRKPTVKNILISNDLISMQLVTLAHEYIHCLLSKYIDKYDDVLTNIHYDELLSILIEYIVSYELSKIFKEDKLIDKNNIIRLEMLRRGSKTLKNAENDIAEIADYIRHTFFGYTISDVYATRLLEIYKDDKKLMDHIIAILKGKKDVESLLDYYDLSLENGKTVDTFVNKIEMYDRIKM